MHATLIYAQSASCLKKNGQSVVSDPGGHLDFVRGITETVAVAAGDTMMLRVQGMGSTSIQFVSFSDYSA